MEHVDPLMGIILPYVNFAIFVGLAVYWFRRPARDMARSKKETFEKVMADARQVREAAEAKLAELTRRETGLAKELADIKAVATETAQQEAAKIVADAERLAEHLRLEARRIAAAEVDKARAALRQEIVDVVRTNVEQRVKTELNPEAQLKLVRGRIAELKTIRAEG